MYPHFEQNVWLICGPDDTRAPQPCRVGYASVALQMSRRPAGGAVSRSQRLHVSRSPPGNHADMGVCDCNTWFCTTSNLMLANTIM